MILISIFLTTNFFYSFLRRKWFWNLYSLLLGYFHLLSSLLFLLNYKTLYKTDNVFLLLPYC